MSPAYAHTDEQLDEWTAAWSQQVWVNGGRSWTLMMQHGDMELRHPCYFRDVCPPHTHTATQTTPRTPQPSTVGNSVEQWRSLVETYFRPADVDRALRIMRCESGGNPNAKNPGSSASGLFQHLGKYWATRSAAAGYGGVSIFDPTANVAVAAWLRDQPGGFSHWVCR